MADSFCSNLCSLYKVPYLYIYKKKNSRTIVIFESIRIVNSGDISHRFEAKRLRLTSFSTMIMLLFLDKFSLICESIISQTIREFVLFFFF